MYDFMVRIFKTNYKKGIKITEKKFVKFKIIAESSAIRKFFEN